MSSPSLPGATVSFPNGSSSCQGPSNDLSVLKAPSKSTFDFTIPSPLEVWSKFQPSLVFRDKPLT